MEGFEGIDLGLDTEKTTKAKAEPRAKAVKYHKGKVEYAPPFYTISIAHVQDMPDFEVIGVNGEVLQIKRGVKVDNIPQAFVSVLENAIGSRQVTLTDTEGKEYREWQDYPAIPYQIFGAPYMERK